MPVTPTYPGVYIEELPSGVRTIVGVATSITAFIGPARRGLVNEPTRIQSFGDFERAFGGLSTDSPMSYAVRHYFQNGGADALIVRIVDDEGERATLELAAGAGTLTLEAVDAGEAGNRLRATVAANDPSNFDLEIVQLDEEDNPVTTETFTDIAIGDLETELEDNSDLVRVQADSTLPATRPDDVADAPFSGGEEAAAPATLSLPTGGANPLVLEASSPGEWGNDLQALVDTDTADPLDTSLFNLTVRYVENGVLLASEVHRNLSITSGTPRFVTDVLRDASGLVRVDEAAPFPTDRPTANTTVDVNGVLVPTASNNDGQDGLVPGDAFYTGSPLEHTGLYALDRADLFNLLCIPPSTPGGETNSAVYQEALTYCQARRAMLILDPPLAWSSVTAAESGVDTLRGTLGAAASINAMVYFPRLRMPDPLRENRLETFVPSGAVAGIIARTDAQRGVWKAPAGIEATFSGVRELTVKMTDGENGRLNPLGVNCLRTFPVYGHVVWGARTLAGADRLASEWKYIPVRRLALYIEESLYRGTQWVVFEPNDEPLWAQIRLNVGSFMQDLFRKGAFQGATPREAFFVKCDSETTTQSDINLGIVNILVGFAPLKPAEFVIIQIQQMAGQLQAA